MGSDPAELDDLLAAWALGAVTSEERDAIDRAIEDDPELSRRASALLRAVTDLDASLPIEPSKTARSSMLARARARPRPEPDAEAAPALFEQQVTAVRDLLAELGAGDWDRHAAPYRWSVHGLVAHLLVVDRYTNAVLGLGELVPGGPIGHLEMGADEIAAELAGPPERTAAAWSTVAQSTIDAIRDGRGPGPDDGVEFHRWPFTTDGLLIARGFELWTHADDIRRAIGRPTGTPPPASLRTMSRLSVNSLPLVLPLVAPAVRFVGARLVLTGDGGATYDLGDADRRSTLIVADVVDYCRLAARRIAVEDLPHDVDGDREFARDLLRAAQAFAV